MDKFGEDLDQNDGLFQGDLGVSSPVPEDSSNGGMERADRPQTPVLSESLSESQKADLRKNIQRVEDLLTKFRGIISDSDFSQASDAERDSVLDKYANLTQMKEKFEAELREFERLEKWKAECKKAMESLPVPKIDSPVPGPSNLPQDAGKAKEVEHREDPASALKGNLDQVLKQKAELEKLVETVRTKLTVVDDEAEKDKLRSLNARFEERISDLEPTISAAQNTLRRLEGLRLPEIARSLESDDDDVLADGHNLESTPDTSSIRNRLDRLKQLLDITGSGSPKEEWTTYEQEGKDPSKKPTDHSEDLLEPERWLLNNAPSGSGQPPASTSGRPYFTYGLLDNIDSSDDEHLPTLPTVRNPVRTDILVDKRNDLTPTKKASNSSNWKNGSRKSAQQSRSLQTPEAVVQNNNSRDERRDDDLVSAMKSLQLIMTEQAKLVTSLAQTMEKRGSEQRAPSATPTPKVPSNKDIPIINNIDRNVEAPQDRRRNQLNNSGESLPSESRPKASYSMRDIPFANPRGRQNSRNAPTEPTLPRVSASTETPREQTDPLERLTPELRFAIKRAFKAAKSAEEQSSLAMILNGLSSIEPVEERLAAIHRMKLYIAEAWRNQSGPQPAGSTAGSDAGPTGVHAQPNASSWNVPSTHMGSQNQSQGHDFLAGLRTLPSCKCPDTFCSHCWSFGTVPVRGREVGTLPAAVKTCSCTHLNCSHCNCGIGQPRVAGYGSSNANPQTQFGGFGRFGSSFTAPAQNPTTSLFGGNQVGSGGLFGIGSSFASTQNAAPQTFGSNWLGSSQQTGAGSFPPPGLFGMPSGQQAGFNQWSSNGNQQAQPMNGGWNVGGFGSSFGNNPQNTQMGFGGFSNVPGSQVPFAGGNGSGNWSSFGNSSGGSFSAAVNGNGGSLGGSTTGSVSSTGAVFGAPVNGMGGSGANGVGSYGFGNQAGGFPSNSASAASNGSFAPQPQGFWTGGPMQPNNQAGQPVPGWNQTAANGFSSRPPYPSQGSMNTAATQNGPSLNTTGTAAMPEMFLGNPPSYAEAARTSASVPPSSGTANRQNVSSNVPNATRVERAPTATQGEPSFGQQNQNERGPVLPSLEQMVMAANRAETMHMGTGGGDGHHHEREPSNGSYDLMDDLSKDHD